MNPETCTNRTDLVICKVAGTSKMIDGDPSDQKSPLSDVVSGAESPKGPIAPRHSYRFERMREV